MDTSTRTLFLVLVGGLLLSASLFFTKPPPHPAAVPAPAGSAGKHVTDAPRAKAATATPEGTPSAPERLVAIETEHYRAEVSSLNAGLKHFALKDARYRTGTPIDIVTTDKPRYYPLAVEMDGVDLAAAEGWRVDNASARAVRLALQTDELSIARKVEAGATPYQLWLTTRVRNDGATARKLRVHLTTYHYVTLAHEQGEFWLQRKFGRSPLHGETMCKHAGDLERKNADAMASGERFADAFAGFTHAGPIAFTAVENVYFMSAIAPESGEVEACRVASSPRPSGAQPVGTLYSARLSYREVTLAPGASVQYRALAYLGPKVPNDLAAVGHSLGESIQTGWFTGLAVGLTWLLREFHGFLGNWGIAIIVLTFVVKAVLFPLTAKQVQSMAKMKALKPEIDRINDMYADDREKKGAAMMELYRKKGINPMAGCFPVLLQLPIWFSLYQSLASNVELFRAPFTLWWHDLSGPDPYFVLPLALGVLMFVQQKITPAAGMDPAQAKMMLYMMPTMITAFMLFLPAGLCLYMFTNSALSIGQQQLIEAHVKRKQQAIADASAGPPADTIASEADDSVGVDQPSSSSKRRSRRGRT